MSKIPEGSGVPREEAEANARLMAAAPELLDALQAIIDSATDRRECPEWLEERIIAARATIAKAEGRATGSEYGSRDSNELGRPKP